MVMSIAAQAQQSSSESVADYRATLNRYCVTCHNETLKTADLMLDKADLNDLGKAPENVGKSHHQIILAFHAPCRDAETR